MTSKAQLIYRPEVHTIVAAVIAVAAVYVYFLIFAQFGFLKAVQAALGENAGIIRPIMIVMGLAGVTGSVLAARLYSEPSCRHLLAVGLGLCAAAAVWSLIARSSGGFYAVAGLTGLGAGLTTVTLAGMLRRAVGDEHLGMIIGLGTGLAYGFCNLPGVFDASPTRQAQMALLASAAGLAGGSRLTPRFPGAQPGGREYTNKCTAAWVVILAALVCLDSAAFYIIQHTPALKAIIWNGAGQLTLNAGGHLAAAVLAGWALDRCWLGRTVGLGASSLLLACWLIHERQQSLAWAGMLYVVGVSFYSTMLVYYPARSGRPGLAALVYAVAGWGGSALGIALAEGRQDLPGRLLLVGGAVILLGLIVRRAVQPPRPGAQPCV